MADKFPSPSYFRALKSSIDAESARFEKLGVFDTCFAISVSPDVDSDARLIVLEFDAYSCTGMREVSPAIPPEGIDFVLEAPYRVWHEMLTSTDAKGRIDLDHTLNTLTHHDAPIRVVAPDPARHDKLFRFQESIQTVFDLAAKVEVSGG